MHDLTGKVVALTGAASGIGRSLAAGLAAEGAELALCDVDEAGLRQTAELAAHGRRISTHVVDVSDRAAVQAFAHAAEQRHGVVDVVVNNAGVGCAATIEEATYDDIAWVLGVNLWGVIHGVQAFLPLLRKQPRAQIVNIASLCSFVPFPANGPYTIAKFGVDALSRTLMVELAGTGISVSCVYPGGVKTNIVRHSRYTTDRDAAGFEHRAATTPDQAARLIIRGMRRNRKRIVIGPDAKLLMIAGRLFPMTTLHLGSREWRRSRRDR